MPIRYDNIGQLTSALGKEASGTNRWHEQFRYAYDPAGNLSSRTANDLVETFNVTSLNELTNFSRTTNMTVAGTTTSVATNVTVNNLTAGQYNLTGNLYADATFACTNVGLVNGTNTFTAIASDSLGRKDTNSAICNLPSAISYSYDANGNLLNDSSRHFTYDDENQLISVVVTNNGGPSTRSDFVYDGKMRRRIRIEYTWATSYWATNQVVHYLYDGNVVIQERDGINFPVVSYTHGQDVSGNPEDAGGIGGMLARTDNQTFPIDVVGLAYYHTDASGNITALISTNQQVIGRYLYDPYGNILNQIGGLSGANLYRFSSKETHPTSGLVYFHYRYYDPQVQRWVNRDPIQENGAVNLYESIANNPIRYIDPTGLMSKCDCQALRDQIIRKAHALADDLGRYDPIKDGDPTKYMVPGGPRWKPGGHFKEILERQGGILKDIGLYFKECTGNDDDTGSPKLPPIPDWVHKDANRHIPLPVYPTPSPIIYVPGSDTAWLNVAGGFLGLGLTAGTIATGGMLLEAAPAAPVITVFAH